MHSTTLKQKHGPTVNTYIWNLWWFLFTEQTFYSNVLNRAQRNWAPTWTFALSPATGALEEHATGLCFNKYRLSSLWLPGIETKTVLLSVDQDLWQINEIHKNAFYFLSGPRGFEATLMPPDKGPRYPSCCNRNLSEILATWKLTAKFPPVLLWTRLQAISLFCGGFSTKCLKMIFSNGKKKKKVNCFIVFSLKSCNRTFHFWLGSTLV